ncbi:MAG: GvpL/GvpF family gas vesicle protein [Gemmatimonadaceae bacterium]
MATYLYCVLPHTEGLVPPPNGVGGARVRVVAGEELDLWVSDVSPEQCDASDAARAHEAVLLAALRAGRTPLPARFGCTFASDDACVRDVTRRRESLRPLLHRVHGMMEMTVTTIVPSLPVPSLTGSPVPPAAQLQLRADTERRTRSVLEALRARLSRALGPVSRSEVATMRGTDPLGLRVAYLVPREMEQEFRAIVSVVAHETATTLVVGGPLAPYDFGNVEPAGE